MVGDMNISDTEILVYDTLINILTRVPVRSLCRFKCVAKDWNELFKTPDFIAQHLHHSSHNHPLLLLHRVTAAEPSQFSFFLLVNDTNLNPNIVPLQNPTLKNFSSFPTLRVVGSCNGLLCLRDHRDSDTLSIWNPATREIEQVPGSRTSLLDLNKLYYFAFGFSAAVNDYKIVKISVSDKKVRISRAEVYSLSTGRWKKIDAAILRTVHLASDPVNANGAVFWEGTIVRTDNSEYGDPEPVVSFDIAEEVFRLLPGPPVSTTLYHRKKLAVFENELAMFHHDILGNIQSSFDLWVMKDKLGKTWDKKYSVGPVPWILRPVSIWRDEIVCRKESPSHVGGYGREQTVLSLLNPHTNELKNLPAYRDGDHYDPFNHVESLVPVANIQVE